MIHKTKTFRYDRLLVAMCCICAGMVLAHLRPQIEPPVHASATSTLNTMKPLKLMNTSELASFFSTEEGRDILQEVVSDEMSKPTPAPVEPQQTEATTVPQMTAEQKTAAANSLYKTVKNTKSSGGSSGSLMKKTATPVAPFATVYSTKSSNGSSGGTSKYRAMADGYYYSQNPSFNTASAYTPRWTNPGDIAEHMANDHGVDVTGKTKSELFAEHDAIHDVIGPVVAGAAVARSFTQSTVSVPKATQNWQPQSSTSSCPGGVCPTQRKGLLARVFGK